MKIRLAATKFQLMTQENTKHAINQVLDSIE